MIQKLNWTNKKVDDDLIPVLRRLNDSKVQRTVDSYFSVGSAPTLNKQSKRIQTALSLFKNKTVAPSTSKSTQPVTDFNLSENEEDQNDIIEIDSAPVNTTSKKTNNKVRKSTRKKAVNDAALVVSEDSDDKETNAPVSSKQPSKRKSSESLGGSPSKKANSSKASTSKKSKSKITIIKR